jgi:ABC-type uncharacterized transport system substrate-binding protein
MPSRFPQRPRPTPWVLGVCWLLGLAGSASAREALIVLSSDAAPYRQAQAALQENLGRGGCATPCVLLKSLTGSGGGEAGYKDAAVVIAVGTEAAAWLHGRLPGSIPLVYCLVADPEGAGLTSGAAVAGISAAVPVQKQVDLMAQALPDARTIGVLYDAADGRDRRLIGELRQALPEGWQVKAVDVGKSKGVAAAIDEMFGQGVDVVWTFADAELYSTATVRSLLLAGLHHKVPVFGFSPQFVRAGALLGVAVSPAAQGEQAAALALKQLHDFAASQPTSAVHEPEPPRYQVAVNLIVREALAVDLPAALLEQCSIVFRKEEAR